MSRTPSAERTLHALALGAWLAGTRGAAGLTQAELAERAGMSQPVVSRVEAGTLSPDVYRLGLLAGALGSTTPGVLAAVERTVADVMRTARALMGQGAPATKEELLQVLGEDVFTALAWAAVRVHCAGANPAPPHKKQPARR
jgi:transcriptional regulator with XRE-family HTH domain